MIISQGMKFSMVNTKRNTHWLETCFRSNKQDLKIWITDRVNSNQTIKTMTQVITEIWNKKFYLSY